MNIYVHIHTRIYTYIYINTYIYIYIYINSPHGVEVKVLHCDIIVSEFELYYIHLQTDNLWKCMHPTSYGLNRVSTVLLKGWIWL